MPLTRTFSNIENIAQRIAFKRTFSAPSSVVGVPPRCEAVTAWEEEDEERRRVCVATQRCEGLQERLLSLSRFYFHNYLLSRAHSLQAIQSFFLCDNSHNHHVECVFSPTAMCVPGNAGAVSVYEAFSAAEITRQVLSLLHHLLAHVLKESAFLSAQPMHAVHSMESVATAVFCSLSPSLSDTHTDAHADTHTLSPCASFPLAAVVVTQHALTRRSELFFQLLMRMRTYQDTRFPLGILTNGQQFQLYWLSQDSLSLSLSVPVSRSPSPAAFVRENENNNNNSNNNNSEDVNIINTSESSRGQSSEKKSQKRVSLSDKHTHINKERDGEAEKENIIAQANILRSERDDDDDNDNNNNSNKDNSNSNNRDSLDFVISTIEGELPHEIPIQQEQEQEQEREEEQQQRGGEEEQDDNDNDQDDDDGDDEQDYEEQFDREEEQVRGEGERDRESAFSLSAHSLSAHSMSDRGSVCMSAAERESELEHWLCDESVPAHTAKEKERALCSRTLSVILQGRALSSLLCASLSIAIAENSVDVGNNKNNNSKDTCNSREDNITASSSSSAAPVPCDASPSVFRAIVSDKVISNENEKDPKRGRMFLSIQGKTLRWVTLPASLSLSLEPPSSLSSLKRDTLVLLRDLRGGSDGRVWLACCVSSGRLVVLKFLSVKHKHIHKSPARRSSFSKKHVQRETERERVRESARAEALRWREVGLNAWKVSLLGQTCVAMPFGVSLQLVRERRDSALGGERETGAWAMKFVFEGCERETNTENNHNAERRGEDSATENPLMICGFPVKHLQEFESLCLSLSPVEALQNAISLFASRKLVHDDIEWRHVAVFPRFRRPSVSLSLPISLSLSSFSLSSNRERDRETPLTGRGEERESGEMTGETSISQRGESERRQRSRSSSFSLSLSAFWKDRELSLAPRASFLDLSRVHKVETEAEAHFLMTHKAQTHLLQQLRQ